MCKVAAVASPQAMPNVTHCVQNSEILRSPSSNSCTLSLGDIALPAIRMRVFIWTSKQTHDFAQCTMNTIRTEQQLTIFHIQYEPFRMTQFHIYFNFRTKQMIHSTFLICHSFSTYRMRSWKRTTKKSYICIYKYAFNKIFYCFSHAVFVRIPFNASAIGAEAVGITNKSVRSRDFLHISFSSYRLVQNTERHSWSRHRHIQSP